VTGGKANAPVSGGGIGVDSGQPHDGMFPSPLLIAVRTRRDPEWRWETLAAIHLALRLVSEGIRQGETQECASLKEAVNGGCERCPATEGVSFCFPPPAATDDRDWKVLEILFEEVRCISACTDTEVEELEKVMVS
jgi:hypothetical protein